ncbi:MAG: ATP-binding protein [Cyclobacteriaceae bacterium]
MISRLAALWKWSISLGLSEDLSSLEKNRLKMLNIVSVAIILLCIFNTITFTVLGAVNNYQPLFFLPIYAVVLWTNYKHHYLFSRIFFYWGSMVILMLYSMANRRMGVEFSILAVACFASIIFKKRLSALLAFCASFVMFSISHNFDVSRPFSPDPAFNHEVFYYFILIFSFGLVFLQMSIYRDITHGYSKALSSKYQELNQAFEQQEMSKKEILESKAQAEAANLAKSEFLANMSHEIRTPLNGVIGFNDLLNDTPLDDTQKQYVANVSQSAHGLLDIVNDVLDFSKIEAGKLDVVIEKTDLTDLCQSVIKMVSHQSDQKGLKLTFSISDNIPPLVYTDPIRLRHVLVNLLANAVKFTNTGEVILKVELRSAMKEDKMSFRFSVIDTGIGIHKSNQQKIFEAFQQEDTSITKKFAGTGLGLTISNTLLGLMGSQLQLSSSLGRGSTFYFDVSFGIVQNTSEIIVTDTPEPSYPIENPAAVSSVHEKNQLLERKDIRVLIVEDNAMNMILIKTLLKRLMPNATLIEAINGKEALAQFTQTHPSIIFMDVQMPLMDGYDVTREIRRMENAHMGEVPANTERVPIIALTAGTVKGDKEKCLEAGMDDYLSKPIIGNALESVTQKWIEHPN